MPRKAMGVKVVNPGGISAFKFNQRKLDVDENHVHWQVTPRQVLAHAGARAARTRRAASAAHPRQQPRRARQHRIDAGDDRRARRPAGAPDAHPVPRLRQRGAEEVLVGRAAAGRGGQCQSATSASTSARSCSARPSPRRATRCASMRNAGLAQPAQVDRRRHRMRGRLRRRAVPLPRAELRQCAAVGHRAGDLPAGERPVAGGADHRPSERRRRSPATRT